VAGLQEEKGKSGSDELTRGERYAARKGAKAARKAADRGKRPVAMSKFAEIIDVVGDWLKEQQKIVLWSAVTGVVIIAIALIWYAIAGKTDREAGVLLKKAITTAQAAVLSEENALDQKGADESYSSVEEKAKKSLESYRTVLSKYSKSAAAAWSKLGEASSLFELGKFEEAQKSYEQALQLADNNYYVKWRALEGVGYALEAKDKYAQAASYFEKIASLADGAYKPESEYHVARMQLAQGARDSAKNKLIALLTDLKKRESDHEANHMFVRAATELRLRELGVDPDEIKIESAKKTEAPAKGQGK
jgi:tetratricopeptide (TPR) repeat protein